MKLKLKNERTPVMDIIAPDDACTMCVKCGVNTMLTEVLPDHNVEKCLRCGQRYRVYKEKP